jgi:hypothetical protein
LGELTQVPYEAVFGRPPRKMMSATGLSPEVVETLTIESTLNAAVGVESDGVMEDHPDSAGESKGAGPKISALLTYGVLVIVACLVCLCMGAYMCVI